MCLICGVAICGVGWLVGWLVGCLFVCLLSGGGFLFGVFTFRVCCGGAVVVLLFFVLLWVFSWVRVG